MKQIIISIFAFLYLSTSMGASLHVHYCMGKIVSWGLTDADSSRCSSCGMQKTGPSDLQNKKNACCTDDHYELKTTGDQQAPNVVHATPDPVPVILSSFPAYPVHLLVCPRIIHTSADAAPDTGANALYLLNGNFRI